MSVLRSLRKWFSSSLRNRRRDSELAGELRVHLDRLVTYNCRLGMSREQAAAEARRRLGALAWRGRP